MNNLCSSCVFPVDGCDFHDESHRQRWTKQLLCVLALNYSLNIESGNCNGWLRMLFERLCLLIFWIYPLYFADFHFRFDFLQFFWANSDARNRVPDFFLGQFPILQLILFWYWQKKDIKPKSYSLNLLCVDSCPYFVRLSRKHYVVRVVYFPSIPRDYDTHSLPTNRAIPHNWPWMYNAEERSCCSNLKHVVYSRSNPTSWE